MNKTNTTGPSTDMLLGSVYHLKREEVNPIAEFLESSEVIIFGRRKIGQVSKRSLVDKGRPPPRPHPLQVHCSRKVQEKFFERFPGSRGISPGLTSGDF